MALCGDASAWSKVGFLLMIIGLAMFIGGFATTNWMISETIRDKTDLSVGLWNMKNCSESSACTETVVYGGYQNDIFKVTKYMECVVLCSYLVGTIMYGVYFAITKARSRCMCFSIITCNIVIVLNSIISMICWLVQIPSSFYPSYSMGFIVTATVLAIVAACLLIKEIKSDEFYTIKSISPRQADTLPSPLPDMREKKQLVKQQKDFELSFSPSPEPRQTKNFGKKPISPSPPPTPSTITKFMLSEDAKTNYNINTKLFRSSRSPPPSYHSSSTRRYGTPNYVKRYDYQAR